MGDIGHFKRVNDIYGHPAGDSVLRGVADLLEQNLRATDVGGRYGGEEFLVILAQNTEEGGAMFAERWREAVESRRFPVGGDELEVTISLGVASYDGERHTNAAELVADADVALYAAKQAGRNRVERRRQD
jgi:diguanylate cyclase (GGDEF)-like protein